MKLVLKIAAGIATTTVILALAATAGAVIGWRTFATATDRGQYVSYANASAAVQNPNGLAVRATGKSSKPYEVSWYMTCEGVAQATSGRVVVMSVASSAKCSVSGSATGGAGLLKVELLRR